MRAVVYVRASTDDQAESGLGLEAQEHACRRWAEAEGAEAVGPFADAGVSGAAALDRRPGLGDAVAALAKGDVLVVAKRDRLGRDPIVVATVEAAVNRKGCRVVSAAGEGTGDDEPTNVLMRRIIDAFGEYERLIIKGRTRAALGAKKRRGERVGTVPYGYDLGGDGRTLVANPAEQEVIGLIRECDRQGAGGRAIARLLNDEGLPTKQGKGPWRHTAVAKILQRQER